MQLKVVILGAGVMGLGLARHFLKADFAVALCDPGVAARETASQALPNARVLGAIADLGPAWVQPDLVIEAVPEKLALKHQVLTEAEAFFAPDVIIASNTSGIPTRDLSAPMRHPERLAIAHFFNPPDVIPVVEVIGSSAMPEADLQKLAGVLRQSGKEPAILRREMPGFVANRIQHAMMRECLHLLDEGVADVETLDAVIRWSIGVRLAFTGPFLQRDLNGLDTHAAIAGYLYRDLSAATGPSHSLSDRVAAGALGRKSGKGFYDWTPAREAAARKAEARMARMIEEMQTAHGVAGPDRDSRAE